MGSPITAAEKYKGNPIRKQGLPDSPLGVQLNCITSLVRHRTNQLNFQIMLSRTAFSRIIRASALVAALIFALPYVGFAHTIPDDVRIQVFVKPEGNRLYLL